MGLEPTVNSPTCRAGTQRESRRTLSQSIYTSHTCLYSVYYRRQQPCNAVASVPPFVKPAFVEPPETQTETELRRWTTIDEYQKGVLP